MPDVISISHFNSDIILQIFTFLSAKDSGIVVQTCKRFLYLLESFQKDFLEPELVACSSSALSERLRIRESEVAEKSSQDSHHKRMRTRSRNKVTPCQVIQQNLSEIRAPPNVAFCFYTTQKARKNFLEKVDALLPMKNCTVVTAMSPSGIQANICNKLMKPSQAHFEKNKKIHVECQSDFSCMLGSFPNAHFVPFCASALFDPSMYQNYNFIHDNVDVGDEFLGIHLVNDSLRDAYTKQKKQSGSSGSAMEEENAFWKVFVVYVSGLGVQNAEDFLQLLQEKYPHAAIIGGVCDEGDIRLDPNTYEELFRKQLNKLPMDRLKRIIMKEFDKNALYELVEKRDLVNYISSQILKTTLNNGSIANMANIKNGIYGIAIGGTVPVRSIVSRGLRSKTSGVVSPSDSNFSVHQVTYLSPGDQMYPYSAHMLKPVHMIHSIKDKANGVNIPARQFLMKYLRGGGEPLYIGVKKLEQDDTDDDGFQLHMLNETNLVGGDIAIMSDGSQCSENSVRQNCPIDLYSLDGIACTEDIEKTLSRLKSQLQDEKLLGSIMYSCNGRGPEPGLLSEKMTDATKFAEHFPSLPCLGFYAGGEIGPTATFGNKDIFRKGKVAFQGFTAVFAVFVVPKKAPIPFDLNDGPENVQKYIQTRFCSIPEKQTSCS